MDFQCAGKVLGKGAASQCAGLGVRQFGIYFWHRQNSWTRSWVVHLIFFHMHKLRNLPKP